MTKYEGGIPRIPPGIESQHICCVCKHTLHQFVHLHHSCMKSLSKIVDRYNLIRPPAIFQNKRPAVMGGKSA
jgi:hypothetical protein